MRKSCGRAAATAPVKMTGAASMEAAFFILPVKSTVLGRIPIRPRPWVDNEYIVYGADMNIALSYHKCMDDWQDDRSLPGRAEVALLRRSYERVKALNPENAL